MDKKRKWIYYGILFIALFLLCYLFPYSHDDWAWGSTFGVERLETSFQGYNGRWAGNLAVLALTRSNLLKTFTMSLTCTFLIFCINEFASHSKKFCLPIFLFLATPLLIFREAIVWTSGFCNYALSLVPVFLFLYLNKDLFETKGEDTWFRRFLFPLLSFLSVLFVEHLTLYVLVLGFSSIIYGFIKTRKINWSFVLYLIGGILGTIIMFSNSAYANILKGSDTYRTIGFASFFSSSIISYFDTIYKFFIAHNYILNFILSGSILILIYRSFMKKKEYTWLYYILSIILVCFPFYNLFCSFSGIEPFLKYTKYINGIFSGFYYISICFSTFFIKNRIERNKILFSLLSILVLTAPLFVVTPIGGRCFFPMYIFWIYITLQFYLNAVERESEFLKVLFLSCICLFYLLLGCVYGYIYRVDRKRIHFINQHSKEEKLVLPRLPYSKYLWLGDPANKEFEGRFRSFYQIDSKTSLQFVPYQEWNH